MTAAPLAIDQECFRARLEPLLAGPDLALGVSGGSDSLGLLLLAAEARAALGHGPLGSEPPNPARPDEAEGAAE